MMKFNRREIIGHGLVAGTALSFSTTPGCTAKGGGGSNLMDKIKAYKTEEFYKDDGSFDEKAAKKAYYEMMEYYSYPIPDRLRTEDFWTLEFGLGEFLEVGMAGILWLNNKEHNYLGHEIFLLPGQMIPEHWHVETEEAEAKKEGWHVRHGWAYMYGEGEPTTGVDARIPPLHKECAEARAEEKVMPGEVTFLKRPTAKHWMMAGPEGAIVSEYATYHDMNGVRFTHPDAKI